MAPLNQRNAEKRLNAMVLQTNSNSRSREDESRLIEMDDELTSRNSRILKLDLDETDILKSAVEIYDQEEWPRFSLLHYLLEVVLTYGVLIGINYLYQLQQLPYFLMLGMFAFFDLLSPFKY